MRDAPVVTRAAKRRGYDQAVAQNIEAENLLANTKENLREVTGQYYEHLSVLLEESPLVTPKPENIDAWLDIAKERSLSLIAAEKEMQIAREDVSRALPHVGSGCQLCL